MLNVALATLAADLGASTGELQWIVSAYLITLAALLLPAGLAGDRWGRKKLLLAGVVIFGASSALAAFAGDTATLIAARAVMGVGAAIILPLTMSILPSIFSAAERPKAVSYLSIGLGLALPIGPIVGGWLIEAPERGWGSPPVLASLIAGTVLVGLFVWRNLKRAKPLVDLRLFRNATFAWGSVATVFASLALMGALFAVPLYLQAVKGYTAMETGIRLIPLILGLIVAGKLAPGLVTRFSHRAVIATGLLLIAAAYTTGSFTTTLSGYALSATWLTIAGLGLGLSMVPAMEAVLAALPPDRAGAGSGLVQTLRQVSGAAAVAGLGSLLNSVYTGDLPPGAPDAARKSIVAAAAIGDPALFQAAREAFVSGMDVVLIVCAIGSLIGAALVAVYFRYRPAAEPRPEYEKVAVG